jgi:hypothetical protein
MEFYPRQHGTVRRPVQVILRDRELPSVVFGTPPACAVPEISGSLDDLANEEMQIPPGSATGSRRAAMLP